MIKDTNTLDIPEPFMTDGEKNEYEQAKKIIQNSRKQKLENAIYDLHFYSQKRTVLETHLPETEKINNWDYNNCLERLLESSKTLLETYKKLNQ